MERKTPGFPCVFVNSSHGAADSLGSVTFVGFRSSSATQQEVFVPATCQSSSSSTVLIMFVCGRSVHVVCRQKSTPGHKTFTWHLAGGKKCDLKVASVLVGGVIMFVPLLLPTRWGKKKKKYIKGARLTRKRPT